MKIAIFCPRFHNEDSDAWQQRWGACSSWMREHSNVDMIRFEELEELMERYDHRVFRHVIVARGGFYRMAFHQWAANNRVSVVDVLRRAAEAA